MALIQFTRNYHDESTDTGFQFEFYCDRCGNGYQTEFQASTMGTMTNALDAASSLFGGFFGNAANAARNVKSAAWEKAHDTPLLPQWRKPSRISTSASDAVIGWTMTAGMRSGPCARIVRLTCRRSIPPSRWMLRSTMPV